MSIIWLLERFEIDMGSLQMIQYEFNCMIPWFSPNFMILTQLFMSSHMALVSYDKAMIFTKYDSKYEKYVLMMMIWWWG